ncbi:MAG TPA: MFS transporter [Leptolyngbyaceae cyanobacterium M33_DOE_097]|uniref:MFS transporter n=1 Tax=Oscillatoriales cyanobacterium SpSt-418 TaxID=2282169 RepID=A0A7C3KE04_9CYAN|nr:MFS transporter [Leptolyngbyaceae cyanobacterium M33_DOE_097]
MGLLKLPAGQDAFLALRYPNYRNLAIARLLLLTLFQMQTVTVGWELYERTRDPLILGGVGLVQILPIMTVTFFAGHFADQAHRKSIILACGGLMTLCSLGLTFISIGQGSIGLIYVCLFLIGLARGFHKPATDALLWQYIPTSAYTNAATWNSLVFQSASVTGPALGGLLIAALGGATPVYGIVTVTSLIYLALIAQLPDRRVQTVKEPMSLRSLSAGFAFLRQHPIVLAAMSLDLFAVLLGGAVTLLPVYARDVLHVGAAELGWMRAAPAMGALLMGSLLVNLPPIRPAGKALLAAVAGFGIVTIIFGYSRSLWLSLLMLFLSGALDNISVVIRHTLAQLWTPDHLRGRVSAINSVFISMSNELGGFESGVVAAMFGAVASVVSGGIGTILVAAIVALVCPPIRNLKELHQPRD